MPIGILFAVQDFVIFVVSSLLVGKIGKKIEFFGIRKMSDNHWVSLTTKQDIVNSNFGPKFGLSIPFLYIFCWTGTFQQVTIRK
jgi:hypothetical protein